MRRPRPLPGVCETDCCVTGVDAAPNPPTTVGGMFVVRIGFLEVVAGAAATSLLAKRHRTTPLSRTTVGIAGDASSATSRTRFGERRSLYELIFFTGLPNLLTSSVRSSFCA